MLSLLNEKIIIPEKRGVPILSFFEKYLQDERVLEIVRSAEEKRTSLFLKGLAGSSVSFIVSAVSQLTQGIHLVILPEKEEAAFFLNDIEFIFFSVQRESREYLPEVFFFPSCFSKPFAYNETDFFSVQMRAEVLHALNSGKPAVLVTYPEAITEKVLARKALEKITIRLNQSEKISLTFLSDLLYECNFMQTDYVIEPGQFSVRGGIVDIFSFANENPYRVEFSGDEVESIRLFDPVTQLSVSSLQSAFILPDIQKNMNEENTVSLFEYITENNPEKEKKLFVWTKDSALTVKKIRKRFEQLKLELNNLPLSENMFLSSLAFTEELYKNFLVEYGIPFSSGQKNEIAFNFSSQPSFSKNFNLLFSHLRQQKENGFQNLVLFSNNSQAKRLSEIYKSIFPSADTELLLPYFEQQGGIHEGFADKNLKLALYTDHQIFERYHRYQLKSGAFKKNEALTMKELKLLRPGDYVTHIDYGIGQFGGLEKIFLLLPSGEKREQESIRLIYRDNDVLHISIHSLHEISKYSGSESGIPTLDKLGSNAWANLKRRTKKKIKELAFDLVKLYAQRKSQKGFAFSPDTYLQNELEASFLYEDTPDQITATADVKRDMESESPMDRLICGDVGFGKTEIAIRAAFKAAVDGKQTAVLVPTTILALQHFKTFSERMNNLPVNVDYINRFKSPTEQKESLKKLSDGKTNIIIGTHRLLGKDVIFHNLGLLIVDEEQKFGVAAKEKLKTLKANVDTLTLTATPIPRTLQFSMLGARDISVINTPPPNRYPVHTEVHSFNEKIIFDAIENEISRGGQVFFVHNRVQNIERYAGLIKNLFPKAKVLVAHGQLKGDHLEKSMLEFIDGQYDVLVSTAIIESGLDIPNANTIIVNDAHLFGLSDLYQLRGRVGRSNKKAFCYLLTPPFASLTDEARKRLRTIEEFSDLGSGFHIALRDLDIRGAGNLLGAEQSGFITEIGYEMYQKILDEAMEELRRENLNQKPKTGEETTVNRQLQPVNWIRDCQIETDLSLLIPDEYVENIVERVALYRQLDNCKTDEELSAFASQLQDRFGKIPESAVQLMNVVRLRWKAVKMGVEKLILKNGKMNCYFISSENKTYFQSDTFTAVLNFIQQNPTRCRMKEGEKLSLMISGVSEISQAISVLNTMRESLKT